MKTQITAVLTVLGDGSKLPPLLVFKGQPSSSNKSLPANNIERVFKTYKDRKGNVNPRGIVYAVTLNHSTDSRYSTTCGCLKSGGSTQGGWAASAFTVSLARYWGETTTPSTTLPRLRRRYRKKTRRGFLFL